MSSFSVGHNHFNFIFICIYITFSVLTNSWILPDACRRPPHATLPPLPSLPPIFNFRNTTSPPPTTLPPTASPTKSPTLSPTNSPTQSPTNPTNSPTVDPTVEPTPYPTMTTDSPTKSPTLSWDESCCNAIKETYNKETCGSLFVYVAQNSCELDALGKIQQLNIADCGVEGNIPNEIHSMNNLEYINMQYNKLSGSLPRWFNDYNLFPNLRHFRVQENNIIGTIPTNIFQYKSLSNINFSLNTNMHVYIPSLNLSGNVRTKDGQTYTVDFSFINVHLNDKTDINLYNFFDKLDFMQFNMKNSSNNFSFVYQNQDKHSIYADRFDLSGNNISGEFPCNFRGNVGGDWFYIANNLITSTNLSCYNKQGFRQLKLFQLHNAYKHQTSCYQDYSEYASISTDYDKYCDYIKLNTSPEPLRNCCFKASTIMPTNDPNTETAVNWFIDNIEWFILLIIIIICIVGYISYRNCKTKTTEAIPLLPRQPKLSTAGKESVLYGDF